MSKVQPPPREELRQGIRELWTAARRGTRLDKQKAIKKIKNAVEREERIMLNKIQVEESDELDDLEGLGEQIEIAEALAAGESVTGEEPVIEVVGGGTGEEPQKKRRGGGRKATLAAGEKPKRAAAPRKKTPNDDGADQPLALGNGHTNGNGLVHLSPAQLSKLWEIVTGGQVGIQVEGGQVTCWVSESSFKKALPAMIDRL